MKAGNRPGSGRFSKAGRGRPKHIGGHSIGSNSMGYGLYYGPQEYMSFMDNVYWKSPEMRNEARLQGFNESQDLYGIYCFFCCAIASCSGSCPCLSLPSIFIWAKCANSWKKVPASSVQSLISFAFGL